jgi:hypothetical protein
MLQQQEFDRFRDAIVTLPTKDRYERADLLCARFHLFTENGLDVYYAPFHYMNRKARVVLIGLTPGWTQMERAFWAAKEGLTRNLDGEDLFRWISSTGSFSGPMRTLLIGMLDGIGLDRCLEVASCAELFSQANHLVHFTSAISAPVFKDGKNYTGNPSPLKVGTLRKFIINNLGQELRLLPDAVVVPLGKVAGEAVKFLESQRLIAFDRCLMDFPHPSGANGHRGPLYRQGCDLWRNQLAKWFCADPK